MRHFRVCTTWSTDRFPVSKTESAATLCEGARLVESALLLGALSAHCELRQYFFGRLTFQKIIHRTDMRDKAMTQRSPRSLLGSLYIYMRARVDEQNFMATAHLVSIGYATLLKDHEGFLVGITHLGAMAQTGHFLGPRMASVHDPEPDKTFFLRLKAGMRIILGETRWQWLHDLKERWSLGR
jgi:hypothetical protein